MSTNEQADDGSATGTSRCDVFGVDVTVYNREAELRDVHGEQSRIVWKDTGTVGFVPTEDLADA